MDNQPQDSTDIPDLPPPSTDYHTYDTCSVTSLKPHRLKHFNLSDLPSNGTVVNIGSLSFKVVHRNTKGFITLRLISFVP